MAKKGFLYFALGAVTAAAATYYVMKNGGIQVSIQVDKEDEPEVKLDEDLEIVEETPAEESTAEEKKTDACNCCCEGESEEPSI